MLPEKKGTSPTVRKGATEIGTYYRNEKTYSFYPEITKFTSALFAFKEEDIVFLAKKNRHYTECLINILSEFDHRYSEAKKTRSYLDFNDLEHLITSYL